MELIDIIYADNHDGVSCLVAKDETREKKKKRDPLFETWEAFAPPKKSGSLTYKLPRHRYFGP